MKNLILSIFIVISAVLISVSSYSQDKIIHGRIFTFDSIPLINADIKVKSTKQVVKTDTTGRFFVGCNNNDVLTVNAKGFYKQKIKLQGNEKLVIVNLKLKSGERNKEIAVGYGYVTDVDKLNAAVNLNNDEMDFSKYQNIYEIIRGRFPGVQISNDEIIIRGLSTVSGSNAALIVVDGIISDNSILSTLSPIQVKSINIIKDGSAAIYGAQGANGVVLIETK